MFKNFKGEYEESSFNYIRSSSKSIEACKEAIIEEIQRAFSDSQNEFQSIGKGLGAERKNTQRPNAPRFRTNWLFTIYKWRESNMDSLLQEVSSYFQWIANQTEFKANKSTNNQKENRQRNGQTYVTKYYSRS